MSIQAQTKEVAQAAIDEILSAMDARIAEVAEANPQHKNDALIRTRNFCASVLQREKRTLSDILKAKES